MGDRTEIEWTDATWNPWQGCHKVSLGCKHCYMFREKKRYGRDPNVVVRSKPHTFSLPLRLKRPQRIFTCSWSDFFIEEADSWRQEAWEIIRRTPHLSYLILTKRMDRAAWNLPWAPWEDPWSHVWIGASVEDFAHKHRIDSLRQIPAAGRFLSLEPLLGDLGKLDLTGISWVIVGGESGGPPERALVEKCDHYIPSCGYWTIAAHCTMQEIPGLREAAVPSEHRVCEGTGWRPKLEALEWVRSLRDQCQAAGIPFFLKQWGGPTPKSGGRILDGEAWDEWPNKPLHG